MYHLANILYPVSNILFIRLASVPEPMNADTKILLTADRIRQRIAELGGEITRDYAGRRPVLVGVLNGAVVFLADLMREIDLPLEMYMMAASSYKGTESTGSVEITKPLDADISGRDVILVEDIVDTGITLQRLLSDLQAESPASLEVCALLNKPSRRVADIPTPRYIAFDIPDEFVVGYGLDYNQQYRNLPHIAVLEFLPP